MDTFRKWLNKPKADDKSLLARFYHADRSLTAVASELDSFDGRAEPDRCSRLVSRLRQGQDKVLAITNLIMEELLGEDRDPRAFRVKFPEEVLQENLAGQLWFGAECLAAGSSIMNREQESKEMRPLAQAVTRSLGNVRNLLRDQCLRNNVPNSKTLHLDINDSTTEQLYESIKIFDRLFAEFELRYVSAMVQVKTKHEYEMQELISVLFSETLQRALKIDLLDQDKVDAFDPALMFSIPRLAIITGLVVHPKGPLDMDMSADQLSEMFRPFRTILIKIRELLRTLDKNQLYQLEKLLCTNEDIHTTVPVGTSSIEAPISDPVVLTQAAANTASVLRATPNRAPPSPLIREEPAVKTTSVDRADDLSSSISSLSSRDSSARSTPTVSLSNSPTPLQKPRTGARAPYTSSISSLSTRNSSARSTPTVSLSNSPTPSQSIASTSSAASANAADWTDDDDEEEDDDDDGMNDDADHTDDVEADEEEDVGLPKELDISADCASGFLIPNTNFGNLLQPQQVPLTDNFIASDDEFGNHQQYLDDSTMDDADADADLPTTSAAMTRLRLADSSEETIKAAVDATFATGTPQAAQNDKIPSTSASVRHNKRHYSSHHCGHDDDNCGSGNTINGEASQSSQQRNRHHIHRHSHPHRHSQHQHQHEHQHHHHHHPQHHHHHHQNSHQHHQRRSRNYHSKAQVCSVDGCPADDAVVLVASVAAVNHTDTDDCVSSTTNTTTTPTTTPTTTTTTTKPTAVHNDTSSADRSTASSLSDGDPHEVSLALRAAGRTKFKNTETLLHRLFVCIAGVADQLQTNFAADLRQILRSVFLMNMSVAQPEPVIPEKAKDSELFEFRASENDVIQESGGSNQSIYSAEEVNAELDNVFNNSNNNNGANRRIDSSSNSSSSSSSNASLRHSTGGAMQRGNTIDLAPGSRDVASVSGTNSARSYVERSRSLGDQENNEAVMSTAGSAVTNGGNHRNNCRLSSYISGRRLSSPTHQNNGNGSGSGGGGGGGGTHYHQRNRNNSVGSNSPSSSSASESNSPISERVRQSQSNVANNNSLNSSSGNNNHNNNDIVAEITTPPPSRSGAAHTTTMLTTAGNAQLSPPAWVPDEQAPCCYACRATFNAFRRRHHCRNCGRVFCGVCSNTSAPLPNYGLTKAVRVCRNCYAGIVRTIAKSSPRTRTTSAITGGS